jgi:hypothetical protein
MQIGELTQHRSASLILVIYTSKFFTKTFLACIFLAVNLKAIFEKLIKIIKLQLNIENKSIA